MIIFDVEQGTDEWHQSRAGKITASMFAEVRKRLKSGPRKGQHTDAADKYAFRLAMERITGKVAGSDQFETYWMKRGKELEEEARLLHEDFRDVLIQRCGFVCTDDELYGASADGLIGDDGTAEYKCFVDPEKLRDIFLDGGVGGAMDQVQGQLWITEREYCDFVLYYPDLPDPLTVRKVHRSDKHISALVDDLQAFNALVEYYQEKIAARDRDALEIYLPEEKAA